MTAERAAWLRRLADAVRVVVWMAALNSEHWLYGACREEPPWSTTSRTLARPIT
jgi:hypothetical protein